MNSSTNIAVKYFIKETFIQFSLLMFFVLLCPGFMSAQDLKLSTEAMGSPLINSNNEIFHHSISESDTLKNNDTTDTSNLNDLSSLSLAIKPKLLPERMSFMERFLWDENGAMRKIGITGPLNPETRENELSARRTMLTVHQIAGLTTLGLMIATDYFGQRVLDGRLDLSGTHKTLVGFTIGTYALTGLMAILSPPPLIRRDNESSTTSIHKILAWIHFAGMILTPILGSLIVNHRVLNINKAHFHQVSAYLTTAVFAASVVVLTF